MPRLSDNWSEPTDLSPEKKVDWNALRRLIPYLFYRLVVVFITVFIGVYVILYVVNLGGFVDEIMKAQIAEGLGLSFGRSDAAMAMSPEERQAVLAMMIEDAYEQAGLNEPLAIRNLRWTWNGMTLNWGDADNITTADRSSRAVQAIVMERLPNTLLLAGSANVLLFFVSVYFALILSRSHGGWLDRLMVTLTPLSSAPSWIHGVVLLVIFAAQFRILPFHSMYGGEPFNTRLDYAFIVLKHMILPVSAIFLSVFFQSVYVWRTYFLVYAGEDYVELAKAKGLPTSMVNRRYVLRPTLPSIITSFMLMLAGFWQGAIALEVLFLWPGVGEVFWRAVRFFDRPLVVGLVIVFIYFLAFSVLILDLVYAWLDPRVKVGRGSNAGVQANDKMSWHPNAWLDWFRRRVNRRKVVLPARKLSPISFDNGGRGFHDTGVFRYSLRVIGDVFTQMRRYHLAMLGMFIILVLVFGGIYAVTSIPYNEAVSMWRSTDWYRAPKRVPPTWTNWFRREPLPESMYWASYDQADNKSITQLSDTTTEIIYSIPVDYPFNSLPDDITVRFSSVFKEKLPFVTLTWQTPDGRAIKLTDLTLGTETNYVVTQDDRLIRRLRTTNQLAGLFAPPEGAEMGVMQGEYLLEANILVFEPDANVDLEFILYGKVFGLAGTDHRRRDLAVPILWGIPVALTIGVVGASVTSVLTIFFAAIGAWKRGWIDGLIQRITELNIMLPSLPVALLIYVMFTKSVWVVLAVMVLLNIFSNALKEYRAIFVQVRELPYIEAARAYGVSDRRMIFYYLLPRILQVVIPQVVIAVPSFVFLETTLAFLGISDPYIPTWGKVIYDALENGVFAGYYYWLLQPIALVLITGLAFALVGFALDNVLNPRLRNE